MPGRFLPARVPPGSEISFNLTNQRALSLVSLFCRDDLREASLAVSQSEASIEFLEPKTQMKFPFHALSTKCDVSSIQSRIFEGGSGAPVVRSYSLDISKG